jgi:uncharacterized protein (TIGR03083 family)
MRPLRPVFTSHLYAPLHEQLLQLLRGLGSADWSRPTACRLWTVHDIAAHILDTQVRIISSLRDDTHAPAPQISLACFEDLVEFLNTLNAEWVTAFRRVSSKLVTDFLSITGPQLTHLVAQLDPYAPAPFAVAWAGERVSPNWFDVGRNYTEYWHHQQQIRDAVNAPGLFGPEWLRPVLSLFVRALPRTYRDVEAVEGSALNFVLEGAAGGVWTLVRKHDKWALFEGVAQNPAAEVWMSDDTAWRLFTKGLSPAERASRIRIAGDALLGGRCLDTVAVVG